MFVQSCSTIQLSFLHSYAIFINDFLTSRAAFKSDKSFTVQTCVTNIYKHQTQIIR